MFDPNDCKTVEYMHGPFGVDEVVRDEEGHPPGCNYYNVVRFTTHDGETTEYEVYYETLDDAYKAIGGWYQQAMKETHHGGPPILVGPVCTDLR